MKNAIQTFATEILNGSQAGKKIENLEIVCELAQLSALTLTIVSVTAVLFALIHGRPEELIVFSILALLERDIYVMSENVLSNSCLIATQFGNNIFNRFLEDKISNGTFFMRPFIRIAIRLGNQ